MDLLSLYGLFLAKIVTVVVAIGALVVLVIGLRQRKSSSKGELRLTDLGEEYREMQREMRTARLHPAEQKLKLKAFRKEEKAQAKTKSCRRKTAAPAAENLVCTCLISKAAWTPTK